MEKLLNIQKVKGSEIMAKNMYQKEKKENKTNNTEVSNNKTNIN